jgi:hypothetical protein
MPLKLYTPQKDAQLGKAGVYSIKTAADAYKWLGNRKKAFGCSTRAEVLQKWGNRKSVLPDKGDLKNSVRASGAGPVTYGPDKEITSVNPILVNALSKAMQIDPQDKDLSTDVIKEMWPTSMILADFCQCLQLLAVGSKFSMGPLKGHERMAEKVADETDDGYDYELANLNDAYRASIVCKDQACYDDVVRLCKLLVSPAYGIAYHKEPKDKFKYPDKFLGYGDYTYFLNFRETDHTAELQIHILGVIFGKTAAKNWGYGDIATYSSLEAQFGIPGGLGHKFYEDYRNPAATREEKEAAKALSMKYYGICRGNKATPDDTKLFREIATSTRH